MSKIKRYYEDLAITVTNAIYNECFDMPDHLETDRETLEQSIFEGITSGHAQTIYQFMEERMEGRDDMPETKKACSLLLPFLHPDRI